MLLREVVQVRTIGCPISSFDNAMYAVRRLHSESTVSETHTRADGDINTVTISPVHAYLYLLAECSDRGVREKRRVERVLPFPWRTSRMRASPANPIRGREKAGNWWVKASEASTGQTAKQNARFPEELDIYFLDGKCQPSGRAEPGSSDRVDPVADILSETQ